MSLNNTYIHTCFVVSVVVKIVDVKLISIMPYFVIIHTFAVNVRLNLKIDSLHVASLRVALEALLVSMQVCEFAEPSWSQFGASC